MNNKNTNQIKSSQYRQHIVNKDTLLNELQFVGNQLKSKQINPTLINFVEISISTPIKHFIDSTDKLIDDFEKHITNLKKQIQEANVQVNELYQKYLNAQQNDETDIIKLKNEIAALQTTITKKDNERDELAKQITLDRITLDSLEKQLEDLQREFKQLQQDYISYQRKHPELPIPINKYSDQEAIALYEEFVELRKDKDKKMTKTQFANMKNVSRPTLNTYLKRGELLSKKCDKSQVP